jgi:hypothetical protein
MRARCLPPERAWWPGWLLGPLVGLLLSARGLGRCQPHPAPGSLRWGNRLRFPPLAKRAVSTSPGLSLASEFTRSLPGSVDSGRLGGGHADAAESTQHRS